MTWILEQEEERGDKKGVLQPQYRCDRVIGGQRLEDRQEFAIRSDPNIKYPALPQTPFSHPRLHESNTET